ncbi:ParA family protein [Candidatus Margulisiibacteriota bacterium]
MSVIYATVNQKGGVGKTTTAINLAAYLAVFGKKVLVIDFDPQGNASSGLGIDKDTINACIYDIIINNTPIESAIKQTNISGLDIIPSTSKLAGAEVELVETNYRESKLKSALLGIRDKYDYLIIDCPPSLSLLTINALTAADQTIIPIQCEYYALEGLSHLTKTIDLIRKSLNPDLHICGILLTMYDTRTVLSEQVADEARSHFGGKVFKSVIPRNVRLAEAPSFGQPIVFYDPSSSGAVAYESLSKEILNGHL